MEFQEIKNHDDSRVQTILKSYETSFPESERRSLEQFNQLFDNQSSKIISIIEEGSEIGYLILWKVSDFVFVEHFEVFEQFRNKKYGSVIIQNLIKKHPKIILEIEPATQDEISNRRYGFYQRNGFHVLTEDYVQPSYGEGKTSLNLWLMSNFESENTSKITKNLYSIVYKFN